MSKDRRLARLARILDPEDPVSYYAFLSEATRTGACVKEYLGSCRCQLCLERFRFVDVLRKAFFVTWHREPIRIDLPIEFPVEFIEVRLQVQGDYDGV